MSKSKISAAIPPEVAAAFPTAGLTALQELVQTEALVEDDAAVAQLSEYLVTATVQLLRTVPGTMSLVLSSTAASCLAARYLPAGTALTSALIDDVVGGIRHVIAGQAKTMLKGTPHHFTMSTPVVTRAAGLAPFAAAASLVATLDSELGPISIYVNLPPSANP